MTVVGELALWIALFLAVWGSTASFAGALTNRSDLVASARRSIPATALMISVAAAGLWAALLAHDFSLEYVAAHTTLNTPTLYLLTAFWAGDRGVILSLALAIALFATFAIWGGRGAGSTALPWITGALVLTLGIMLGTLCFVANPYDRVEWVPAEGRGLSSHLQDPLATPYFLATHGGYGALAVALTIAGAAALTRPVDANWLGAAQRWSMVSWVLLTVSMAIGMRWSYNDPAVGGLWRWDFPHAAQLAAWLLTFLFVRRFAMRSAGWSWTRGAVYVAYIGLTVVLSGVAATRWWSNHAIRLRPGESLELTDPFRRSWRFVSQGASRDERMNYLVTGVAVEALRGVESAGIISAERRQYLDSVQRPTSDPVMKPGIRSSPALDVYVVLAGLRDEVAQLRVGFRPLVALVWIGWMLVAGAALALAVRSNSRIAGRGDSTPARAR